MASLEFYDLKAKKKFKTSTFKIITKNGRRMAQATAPSGIKATRFVAKDFKK